MRQSFIGSTIAIVVAVASIVSGVRGFPYSADSLFGGMTAIAGIMAYRSAKKRRLGLIPDSIAKRRIEVGLLVLTWLPPLLVGAGDIGAIVTDPVSCLIVPVWCVIAYIWVGTHKKSKDTATTLSIRQVSQSRGERKPGG